MRAEAGVRPVRDRRPARVRRRGATAAARRQRLLVWPVVSALATTLVAGVAFAGSPERIAAGVTVAGVDVAGMRPEEARAVLSKRAARYSSVPVVFTAGSKRWPLTPEELDARVDWSAAAEEAQSKGDWPLPLRGLKRVALRFFGADVEPTAKLFAPRLEHELDRVERGIGRRGRHAAIVLHGFEPRIVPDRAGRVLERSRAKETIAKALAGFDRRPVALPVRVERPDVTAEDLRPVAEQVRTALSGAVRFGWKDARWFVTLDELADFLVLPANGSSDLRIGGPKAERYFRVLSRAVDRRPRNAEFAVTEAGRVRVVPAAIGRKLDIAATERVLLAGALSRERREATLVVRTVEPKLTTERARAMGVTRVLASYTTPYSGTADRIRNLQLATALLDGTLLAPDDEFSFNATVGPRTEERGFRPAPVIVDGEYEEGIGGGVSQVATTVFNAAWEAGVKITARTAHALYISRYPLGRDATVNYPDTDLRFLNDTDRWLVVRATAGDTGITVTLLGARTKRRVVSEAGPLEETGPPKVEEVPDPTLFVGQKVVEDEGEPSRAVTVKRTVYEGGEVLYEEAWHTSYRSEAKIVRAGTIPRPVPEEPGRSSPGNDDSTKGDKPEGDTSTTPTTTTPTTTTPTTTTPTTTTQTTGAG